MDDLTKQETTPSRDFAGVVRGLKTGRRFARAGWNGKGMFIFLVNGSTFKTNREPLLSILGEGVQVQYRSHIDIRTANGSIVPWVAAQTDILATDWFEFTSFIGTDPAVSPATAPEVEAAA